MILTHGANSIASGGDFVEIGGRKYPTVTIGNQVWLAENLDYKFTGCDIGPTGSLPSTPAAWYYNNNETDYGIDGTYKCGLLYNFHAANLLETNKSTLLPDGWHVPTQDELNTLSTSVGGDSTAGLKLKTTNNSVTSNWPSGWNGTNDYGFSMLPAGWYNGTFHDIGTKGQFWTSTELIGSGTVFYSEFTTADSMSVPRYYMDDAKSLRLVKDAT